MMADMKRAHDSFQVDDRDRRPPPDFDPVFGKGYVDEHGVYWAVEQWQRFDKGGPFDFSMTGGENGSDAKENLDEG